MTAEQAKKFKYWQYRTIIATMIGYALFYFVRKNFSFAIPGLGAEYVYILCRAVAVKSRVAD